MKKNENPVDPVRSHSFEYLKTDLGIQLVIHTTRGPSRVDEQKDRKIGKIQTVKRPPSQGWSQAS